jgi:hypothetical protein
LIVHWRFDFLDFEETISLQGWDNTLDSITRSKKIASHGFDNKKPRINSNLSILHRTLSLALFYPSLFHYFSIGSADFSEGNK